MSNRSIIEFPQSVSFTLTNACNLRCRMCGQWSTEGYIRNGTGAQRQEMDLADWLRLVDELAAHQVGSVLLRGGEPLLFPGIVDLLEHLNHNGIFVAIDTNGTMLSRFAADLVRIGGIHLTISVDGPEEVHDQVRGIAGTFRRLREGLAWLRELEQAGGQEISKSINFTISPYSVRGLGAMPGVARDLSIGTISIVPYYYVPDAVGRAYERVLRERLGCDAFSWCGFHHETSGVEFSEFQFQYRQYLATLDGIRDYPYMPLTEDEYRTWFEDPVRPVGSLACTNVEALIDIQPTGEANFCVDFPDYSIGSVKEATIEELWNGERATRFRQYRRLKPLPVCYRCGAKYMSEIGG